MSLTILVTKLMPFGANFWARIAVIKNNNIAEFNSYD